MKHKSSSTSQQAAASIAVTILTILATSTAWSASQLKTLHVFGGTDGEHPNCGLISDHAGNLYGTVSGGGARGFGNVFELNLGENGQWTETVLHDFNSSDGAYPQASL